MISGPSCCCWTWTCRTSTAARSPPDVRADEIIRDTPIVFLTSLVTPREVAAGKRIEGYPCLSKPTCADDLVRVIEESLATPCAA